MGMKWGSGDEVGWWGWGGVVVRRNGVMGMEMGW